MDEDAKPCYLCDRYKAVHVRSGLPVCEACDLEHIAPARAKNKGTAPAQTGAPKTKEAPKEEEKQELGLEWEWSGIGPPIHED